MDCDVDQYCLRWKYHHSNLQYMFAQLLENGSLCDVTLACEGKTLRVHKIMLSACSAYFDSIFSKYEENDPIVILDGIRFDDVTALVEFMYRGEITVEKSRLNALIETAEELQVKGLAAVSWRSTGSGWTGGDNEHSNDSNGQYTQFTGIKRKLSESSVNENNYSDDTVRNDISAQIKQKSESFSQKLAILSSNCEKDKLNVNNINCISSLKKQKIAEILPKVPIPKLLNALPATKATAPVKAPMPLTKENLLANTQATGLLPVKEEALSDSENSDSSLPIISGVLSLSGREKSDELNFSNVVKMNDHIQQGGWRPHFWELESTKKVMDAIKNKKLEMKYAAELLGVTYGTLYGRYREVHGYLKQPQREFWHDVRFAEILGKLKRKEITLFTAADLMNISASVLANHLSKADKDPSDLFFSQPFAYLDPPIGNKSLIKMVPSVKSPLPNKTKESSGETSFILPPIKIPDQPDQSCNVDIKLEPESTDEDSVSVPKSSACESLDNNQAVTVSTQAVVKKEPEDSPSCKEIEISPDSVKDQSVNDSTIDAPKCNKSNEASNSKSVPEFEEGSETKPEDEPCDVSS